MINARTDQRITATLDEISPIIFLPIWMYLSVSCVFVTRIWAGRPGTSTSKMQTSTALSCTLCQSVDYTILHTARARSHTTHMYTNRALWSNEWAASGEIEKKEKKKTNTKLDKFLSIQLNYSNIAVNANWLSHGFNCVWQCDGSQDGRRV